MSAADRVNALLISLGLCVLAILWALPANRWVIWAAIVIGALGMFSSLLRTVALPIALLLVPALLTFGVFSFRGPRILPTPEVAFALSLVAAVALVREAVRGTVGARSVGAISVQAAILGVVALAAAEMGQYVRILAVWGGVGSVLLLSSALREKTQRRASKTR